MAILAQRQADDEKQRQADQARIDAARKAEEDREKAEVEQVVSQALDQAYRNIAAGRWVDARNSVARASDRLAGRNDTASPLHEQVRQAARDLEMATLPSFRDRRQPEEQAD